MARLNVNAFNSTRRWAVPGLVGVLVVVAMTPIAPIGLHLLGTRGLLALARP